MMLRKGISVVILFSLLVVLMPVNKANAAPNWNLVWSDEFNGTSLNRANWTPEIGTGGGWGNNEAVLYRPGTECSGNWR